MQVVACALLVLVGVAIIAAAVDPTLPLLRSVYWWRIPFRGRPTRLERLSVAGGGLLWIAVGGGLFAYLFIVR